MSLYTVHVPDHVSEGIDRADRTVFVPEGFTLRGLVFGVFYLAWHRAWGAVLAWGLLVAALVGARVWLGLPVGALLLVLGLAHWFVGLEGNDLRRWSLNRRHYRFADVVSGRRADAEYAYFLRTPGDDLRRTPPSPRAVPSDSTPTVIGMFADEDRP